MKLRAQPYTRQGTPTVPLLWQLPDVFRSGIYVRPHTCTAGFRQRRLWEPWHNELSQIDRLTPVWHPWRELLR